MKKHEYKFHFLTKDSQPIAVRSMVSGDTELLIDIFEHMSSESRYRRFHQTVDHVSANRIWQEAYQISHSDPAKSFGLIAFAFDALANQFPVGIARFMDSGPGEAELAISVRDDYQNLGIGTNLMRLLADEAKNKNYRRLMASIQNDNKAIWRVFQHLPYHIFRTNEGGFANIIIILSPINDDQLDNWKDPPYQQRISPELN